MQTFLPYPNFQQSLEVLDVQRLGKQRVESMQILRVLRGQSSGWRNHPATLMWRGYEEALEHYLLLNVSLWQSMGYNNNIDVAYTPEHKIKFPDWLGGPIHSTHRAALLWKDPEWYEQFGWEEEPVMQYYWPEPMHV